MKIHLLFVPLTLIVFSCGTAKEVEERTPPPHETQEYLGKITSQYTEFGCGYLIEGMAQNQPTLLNPVNLSDEFKVNGLDVRFRYRHADDNGSCDMARPVFLEKMEKLNP